MATPLAFATLVIASNVTVHIEVVERLKEEQVTRFMVEMESAFEAALGAPIDLDPVRGLRCDDRPRCHDELRARTKAEEVVLVRLIGAIRRTGVYVERCDRAGVCRHEESTILNAEEASWRATFTAIAAKLFPEGLPRRAVSLEPPAPPPSVEVVPDARELVAERERAEHERERASRSAAGGLLLGGGAGAAAAGLIGVLLSRTVMLARVDDADTPSGVRAAVERARGVEVVGTVLVGAGAALVVASFLVPSEEE